MKTNAAVQSKTFFQFMLHKVFLEFNTYDYIVNTMIMHKKFGVNACYTSNET